mgnify:CR=1 FL=1
MNHLSTRLLLLAAPGLLATSALANYSPSDWHSINSKANPAVSWGIVSPK